MRAIRADRRHRSGWRVLLWTLVALPIGGVGTVAALGAFDVIDLGKLAFWRKPITIPPGWVGIPVCTRSMPAYTAVSREYLLNPKTADGSWLMDYQPPEKAAELVGKGVIIDIEKIRGRVTAREKLAPSYFSESDFLPLGTRPGVVGGTPSGKRAYTLEVKTLKGSVHDLREGDRVDLLASVPVDMPGSSRSPINKMGSVVASPEATVLPKRGMVRALVQDGIVVSSVRLRNIPVGTRGGVTTRTIPVEEIVIAVEPEEVAPLAEALDLKYEITCVARSGRPVDAGTPSPQPSAEVSAIRADSEKRAKDTVRPVTHHVPAATSDVRTAAVAKPKASDVTPGYNPMGETRYMEIIVGQQRHFVVFGGPNASPVVASDDSGSVKAGSPGESAGADDRNRR